MLIVNVDVMLIVNVVIEVIVTQNVLAIIHLLQTKAMILLKT